MSTRFTCFRLLVVMAMLPALWACDAPTGPDPITDTAGDGFTDAAAKQGAIATNRDLAALRRATARFHRPEAAVEAGYGLVDGLDHCFDNPPVGGMGYHYIDAPRLDLNLDLQRPEAIVYAPAADGGLKLAAVEYIVPAEAWDAANAEPPMLFGRTLHLNVGLGVYVLHVWAWMHNPAGMFEDWNPDVSCP